MPDNFKDLENQTFSLSDQEIHDISSKIIGEMLKQGDFEVMYPDENTEEATKKLADTLANAFALATFEDEEKQSVYGVLVDKNAESAEDIGDTESEETNE